MKKSSLFGFGALEAARGKASEAAQRRDAVQKQLEEGADEAPNLEFPPSFVDGREKAIECLRINTRFTDDLAHAISRADDSGNPQTFSTVGTKHGPQVATVLNAMTDAEISRILERKVERHGSGYTFYPHKSVLSGTIKKVPALLEAA